MTPIELVRIKLDLEPRGRFGRKDPALLALARALLAEVGTTRELLREAQYHVTTGEPLDRRIHEHLNGSTP